MQALLVVDFLQELPNRSLRLLQIVVLRAVDFLVFEGLDKTLRSGIVVGRCRSAHADANVALLQLCRVVVRSILHAPVRMVRDWVSGFSGGLGRGFCVVLKGKGAGSAPFSCEPWVRCDARRLWGERPRPSPPP